VIDELCNIIRKGCTLDEFKKACTELSQKDQEESKTGDLQKDLENEFYSIVGTQGWSVLHAASSSNNIEIVDYLLNKK